MAGWSSSSSSSSSSAPSPKDPTYLSLLTLLSSPSASSRHLRLLPPGALYGSITQYLSRLDTTKTEYDADTSPLEHFTTTLLSSESFWAVDDVVSRGGSDRIHEDVTKKDNNSNGQPGGETSVSLLSRLYEVHLAVARAVFAKVEQLLHERNGSIGWGTQSALKKWADVVAKVCSESATTSTTTAITLSNHKDTSQLQGLPRFAILTGLLVGLGAYRQQQRQKKQDPSTVNEKPALDVTRAFHAAQYHWVEAWHLHLEQRMPIENPTRDDNEWEKEFAQVASPDDINVTNEQILLLLHLAGQVSPYLSDRVLATIKPEVSPEHISVSLSLTNTGSRYQFHPFAQPILTLFPRTLFPLFRSTLLQLDAGKTPQTHALYPLLGPLSRMMAAAGEAVIMKLSQQEVQRLLLGDEEQQQTPGVVTQLSALAQEVRESFLRCDQQQQNNLSADVWTSLKALLFISVQFFDAVLDGVVEILPSPVYNVTSDNGHDSKDQATHTSNIPPVLTTILVRQVETLMRLGFVTFSNTIPTTGAQDGDARGADSADSPEPTRITSNEIYNRFTTYRRAFYGALEVIKSDQGASVYLLHRLRSYVCNPSGIPSLTERTSWLARAHLTIYLDASEQLLTILPSSLIETQILPLCRPFLLDATYPSLFESAHSNLLATFEAKKAVCKDLMPFYLDSLLDTFPKGHLSQMQLSHALCTILACTSDVDDAASWYVVERVQEAVSSPERKISYGQEQPQQVAETPTAATTTTNKDETRLQLQLAYIDLLPYVNLVLLRSLLSTVEKWILAARENDDATNTDTEATPLAQLCKRTFKALNGMDDTARQEGVRWWLDKRESFGV